jgi:hypothetical protein
VLVAEELRKLAIRIVRASVSTDDRLAGIDRPRAFASRAPLG